MCYLLIDSLALVLGITGSLLMYFNSLAVSYGTFIYTHEEGKKLRLKAKRKNKMIKLGAFLLFIGFLIQLVSLWFKHFELL